MRIYGPSRLGKYLRTGSYCGEVPFMGSLCSGSTRCSASGSSSCRPSTCSTMSCPTGSSRSPRWALRRSARRSRGSPGISATRVFYYDPFAAPADTVARIDGIVGEIQRDPKAAAQQALAARAIFDEKFAGEVMLGNAVRYFTEWRERAGRARDPADGPLIDVVIRAVHSPIGNVYRALRSIDGQTAGRFRVILVCCNGLDAAGLAGASLEPHRQLRDREACRGRRPAWRWRWA